MSSNTETKLTGEEAKAAMINVAANMHLRGETGQKAHEYDPLTCDDCRAYQTEGFDPASPVLR